MATQLLRDTTCRAAKAPSGQRLELWDSHTRGLCLRVGAGRKVWLVRYRADGVQRRFVLGEYGDSSDLEKRVFTLADARAEAAVVMRSVRVQDQDPAAERKRQRTAKKAQPIRTFNDLADRYLADCRAGLWKPRGRVQSARTLKDVEDSLTRYLRPEFGDDKLAEITRERVKRFLRGMAARGIGAQTNTTRATLSRIFNYAIAEFEGRLVQANPTIGVEREPEAPRQRVLSDKELKALWVALRDPKSVRLQLPSGEGKRVPLSDRMALLLRLSLVTIQRRSEISGMMRSEVDLDQAVWSIPPARMKSRRAHIVPLSPPALAILREAIQLAQAMQSEGADCRCPDDFPIFPSPRDVSRPIEGASVTHALRFVVQALGLTDLRPHDLRRTGATLMTSERLAISPFIRSQVLSHGSDTGGGAAVSLKHYDANAYVAEKRRALVAWADLLLEIVGEKARTANVQTLRPVA